MLAEVVEVVIQVVLVEQTVVLVDLLVVLVRVLIMQLQHLELLILEAAEVDVTVRLLIQAELEVVV
jgi:hypothetical protein